MDVLGQFLDAREEEPTFPPADRPAGERLERFDRWLRFQLAKRIDWTWAGDPAKQEKRREQARIYVERMIFALWRRGWLLDGESLGKHIITPLDAVAKYQKEGKIKEFWPYFCATIDRYVGVNSEEIQIEAKTLGAVIASLWSKSAQNTPSLTELLTRRASEVENERTALREKQAAYRRNAAPSGDLDPQLPLL